MRKAFTLVELLVVIAIISLLISILAPSLNIAKDIAKQVVCASNMNSAAKSIMLYCEDNSDKYPPRRCIMKSGKPSFESMPNAEKTFQISVIGDLDPVTLVQRWRGAGMVYGTRYMENPDYLYCPAQPYIWFIKSSYQSEEKAFGNTTFAVSSNVIRSGYLWNAWGRKYADGTIDMFGKPWDHAFRTLTSMDSDKPLIIDHAIFPWCAPVHTASGVNTPTFNIAYCDGHVSPATADAVYIPMLIVHWGGNGVLVNWADNPGDNNDWADAYYILTGVTWHN